jgi:hypothetical protein
VRPVFDGLFLASTVSAVSAALRAAELDPDRRVAVVGDLRLARALADRGHKILTIAADGRGLRRLKKRGRDAGVQAAPDALPLLDHSLAGLVGVGVVGTGAVRALATVLAWSQAVIDGGPVILVDKVDAAEASRIALCAGLSDIEQRPAGRGVVTSGQVSAL